MPTYAWLLRAKIDPADVTASVVALSKVGTPYPNTDEGWVSGQLQQQGTTIVGNLSTAGITAAWDDEIVALIAYLQRLGTDGKAHLAQTGGDQ